MRHEDRPRNIPDLVHAAEFPVYGLVNNPFDLVVCGYTLGISSLLHLLHVEFEFRDFPSGPDLSQESFKRFLAEPDLPQGIFRSFPPVPEFPQKGFRITSFDIMHEKAEGEKDLVFNVKNFYDGGDVEHSTLWQGKISVVGDVFSGDIIHRDEPSQATAFLLRSEKIVLFGKAYNCSLAMVFHLLESLQVINDREELIEQYHREQQEHPIVLQHIVVCQKPSDKDENL